MIYILLAILAFTAYQGEDVSLYVDRAGVLSVEDCLIPLNFKNNTSVTPGTYNIHVSLSCKEMKKVWLDGFEIAWINVANVTQSRLFEIAQSLERENIELQLKLEENEREIANLKDNLSNKIAEKDRLEREKNRLENELKALQESYATLQKLLDEQQSSIALKDKIIEELEQTISGLEKEGKIYRAGALFLVFVFVGSFVAIFVMSKRES